MKLGLSLENLAKELERQYHAKRDFVANTRSMDVAVIDKVPALVLGPEVFPINTVAHNQIAEHVKIPKQYYDRMIEELPELWGDNIRAWFKKFPKDRMARTLDARLRAFLSESYRPLDNHDLAEAVIPIIQELGLIILSAQITDTRFYIKAVDPRIERDIPKGGVMGEGHVIFDTLCPCIIITNSEVGMGMLRVESGFLTKQCTNLATFADSGMKRRHLGGKQSLGDDEVVRHLLSDETKKATDKAVYMQVRDVVRGAFEEARFDAQVAKIKGLVEHKIEGDPIKVVELTAKKFSLSDPQRVGVLKHLISGGSLTQYGLMNAITRTAEDQESYDDASDLEKLGGKIVELTKDEWHTLAIAA